LKGLRKAIRQNFLKFFERLAYLDPLTQGSNRTAFERDLEAVFNQKKKLARLNLVILDLNKLKQINDTFGHVFGDDAIHSKNSQKEYMFGIAYGSVTYDSNIDKTAEKLIHRADAKMYQEKHVNQIKTGS